VIRWAFLVKSPVNDKRRTGSRVGKNSPTFLRHGLDDFVRFHRPVQNSSGQNQTSLLSEKLLCLAAKLDFVWAGLAKKLHFAPNLTPYRFQKFDPTLSILASLQSV